jgi:hypothetical protein
MSQPPLKPPIAFVDFFVFFFQKEKRKEKAGRGLYLHDTFKIVTAHGRSQEFFGWDPNLYIYSLFIYAHV